MERDINLIDLEELIPQTDTYFYDQVHYNDNGSKLAASIIAEHLLALVNTLQ